MCKHLAGWISRRTIVPFAYGRHDQHWTDRSISIWSFKLLLWTWYYTGSVNVSSNGASVNSCTITSISILYTFHVYAKLRVIATKPKPAWSLTSLHFWGEFYSFLFNVDQFPNGEGIYLDAKLEWLYVHAYFCISLIVTHILPWWLNVYSW